MRDEGVVVSGVLFALILECRGTGVLSEETRTERGSSLGFQRVNKYDL